MSADVAVITAAYKPHPDYLMDAYRSLLEQKEVSWRWLIQVDDEHAELPDSLLEDPRVEVAVNGRQMGAALTRVAALTRLDGERYVQNLDADDQLFPGALQALAGALDAEPQAAFAFGYEVTVHEDGSERPYSGPLQPGLIPAGVFVTRWRENHHPPAHPAGVMWRAEPLIAYGAWSALWNGQDTAVLVAASVHHPCVFVDQLTFWYRWHGEGQLSRGPQAQANAATKVAFIEMRASVLEAGGPAWRPATARSQPASTEGRN